MSIEFNSAGNGVYIVTLNRPERLNALDTASKMALGEVWQEAEMTDDVRAIVVCGAGPKAFCAGSDVQEIRETGEMVTTAVLANALPGIGSELTKPVIAALHGFCIGMGISLAAHCDIRIAHENTKFAFPEVQHGMLSGITAVTLPAIIGEAHALDIMLTGRTFGAQAAKSFGLISEVVADPLEYALDRAKKMVSNSSNAMRLTKRLILAERRRLIAAHFDLIDSARIAVTGSPEYLNIVAGEADAGRLRK